MGNRVTRRGFLAATGAAGVALSAAPAVSALEAAEPGERPDLVVHHGKIVTVDPDFRIAEAMAVAGERILAVGANDEILKLAQPGVQQIDLQGKTVLPGLIDSHMHPIDAAMYEFDHPVPDMESITDVLDYVRSRAAVLPAGAWIAVEQVFITRLRERRFPTRQELDQAAPKHPVCFSTGPDASLNSLALSLSGIDRNFKVTDGQQGFIERDSAGEPTGIVRNGSRFIKIKSSRKTPGAQDRLDRVKSLLAAYNEVGITSVGDRSISFDAIPIYQDLLDRGQLTCRIFLSVECDAHASLQAIEAKIQTLASHPLHQYNNRLWLRGTKVYLDGGMLTGTAYMRKPWGVSKIYSITDPEYRGLLFIEPQRLYEVFRLSLANGLQTSAHSVGDGAVHAMLDAYERIDREMPVRSLRPCISHSNFMSMEAIEKMQALGVVADLQPVWLYMDGATLLANFGAERLAWFQPYRTLFEHGVVVGGGSDHMQKMGRRRSINSYDPFLGMWTTLTRRPRWTGETLHAEQCLTRRQAIELYTINNARLTFEEKEKGSLEPGKLADFIVLDKDILTCPVDDVKDLKVERTYLGGKCVFP
ncbi:MAG: amidohydrolase [Thermoguttaceae bacterium]|jgi:predicted amidohydrolase YtcJ